MVENIATGTGVREDRPSHQETGQGWKDNDNERCNRLVVAGERRKKQKRESERDLAMLMFLLSDIIV